MTPVEMFGRIEMPPIGESPYFFTLGPHSFYWFSLEPAKTPPGMPLWLTGEGEPPLRTDLAWTLFLSDPDSYDGGELVIESHEGETPVKLPAGALVVYDCGALHRVAPVTRGERLACVGWIQSRVRDSRQRELLFTLDQARRALHGREGGSPEFLQLSQVHSQLLRMWAEA